MTSTATSAVRKRGLAPCVFAALLDELMSLIVDGVVPPGSATVSALADGPSALAALESRSTVGKLALRP